VETNKMLKEARQLTYEKFIKVGMEWEIEKVDPKDEKNISWKDTLNYPASNAFRRHKNCKWSCPQSTHIQSSMRSTTTTKSGFSVSMRGHWKPAKDNCL
jgi:hypothetical protein